MDISDFQTMDYILYRLFTDVTDEAPIPKMVVHFQGDYWAGRFYEKAAYGTLEYTVLDYCGSVEQIKLYPDLKRARNGEYHMDQIFEIKSYLAGPYHSFFKKHFDPALLMEYLELLISTTTKKNALPLYMYHAKCLSNPELQLGTLSLKNDPEMKLVTILPTEK